MRAVAHAHGHESAFVVKATQPEADWHLRFFVPQHEMEMCGHATVGTLWALRQWKLWTKPTAAIQTLSGLVDAQWDEAQQRVWISQPRVSWSPVAPHLEHSVIEALGLDGTGARVMVNASTSRVKTLVALNSVKELQQLKPRFESIEAVCTALGSTGLYPYAVDEGNIVFARQFPKASGYPEDAATGIAAAALWGYLQELDAGEPLAWTVRQGDAMGKPSAIDVRPRLGPSSELLGCWISGRVDWMHL